MTGVRALGPRFASAVRAPGTGALVAFSAVAVGAGLGRAVTTSYVPVLLADIHDLPGLIGTVMLVNVLAGLAVPLLVGAWSDSLRVRGHGRTVPFVVGGAVLAGAGLLGIALAAGTSYALLGLLALITYTGLNALTTGHRSLIAESIPAPDRARATGAEEVAMLLGTLAGVAVGGVLIGMAAGAPFALAGLAMPLLAVPTALRMRGREVPAVPPGDTGTPGVRHYLRAARRPGVRLVLAGQGLWVLGYAALPTFFVLYAERVLGTGPALAGLGLVGVGLVTGVAMLLCGSAREPRRQADLVVAGAALMALGLAALVPASSPADAVLGLTAAAAGFGMVSTVGFPLMTGFIPDGEAGAYTALYFSVRAVAGAVALPAAGWAIEASGSYRALTVGGAAAGALSLVPLLRLRRLVRGARSRRRLPHAPGRWLAAWAAAVAVGAGGVLLLGVTVALTPLQRADEALFEAVNRHGPGPEWLDALLVSPDLRNYMVLTALAALAALAWHRPVGRVTALVVGAGTLAFVAVRAIWAVWERARPEEVLEVISIGAHHLWAPYPSFPSGHVAVTVAMALAIAWALPRLRWPLLVVVLAVAVTRVLGGAHLPSDVVGAVALGVGAAWATRLLLDRLGLTAVAGGPPRAGGAAGEAAQAPASAARTTRAESRNGRNELGAPS